MFLEDFETTLAAWDQQSDVDGRLTLSSVVAFSGAKSLKITVDPSDAGAAIRKSGITDYGQTNRWYWSRLQLYLPSAGITISDLYDGGNQWGATIGGLSTFNAAVPSLAPSDIAGFYAATASEIRVFDTWSGADVPVNLDEWIDIQIGFRFRPATDIDVEFIVNGVTEGSFSGGPIGANLEPDGPVIGDQNVNAGSPSFFFYVDAYATQVDDPVPDDYVVPDTPCDTGRFFAGYPWRFIDTNLNSETLTILDRLASGRRVTPRLGAAWDWEASVPSDSPEVNILRSGGSFDPFVQEGISLIYGFRYENCVWTCRFGGILLKVVDDAEGDQPESRLQAWDPWMYLYSRPVRDPDTGLIPGEMGLNYSDSPADEIVVSLLDTTILYDGDCFLDTSTGIIDPCPNTDVVIQRGASVGEALDQVMATNNCEIMFTPVYDPIARPGIVAELNVAPSIGQDRPEAVMAWDKPSRSLAGLNRGRDGLRRTNVIQYYAGRGGRPVDEYQDATSEARFGLYYEAKFFPGKQALPDGVASEAQRQLALRSFGEITYQVSPATTRAPIPYLEYMPGDTVPVYASSNFREELAETLRVMEIPIQISDDAEESVQNMLLAPVPTTET